MKGRRGRLTPFLVGTVIGIAVGLVTSFVIGALVPKEVPSETASNFFFAASGVNATLLVAIAVTIATILTRTPPKERRLRMLFFVAQLTVVFIGTIAAGLGILLFNGSTPFDSSTFLSLVNLVFTTWVIGFVLLIAGIWTTVLEEDSDLATVHEKGHRGA